MREPTTGDVSMIRREKKKVIRAIAVTSWRFAIVSYYRAAVGCAQEGVAVESAGARRRSCAEEDAWVMDRRGDCRGANDIYFEAARFAATCSQEITFQNAAM
jgi:hypothetical protein